MFGLLSKKLRAKVGLVGGFGKVPALGDFVRTSSPSDEMIAFETWITRALESAEARLGPELKQSWKSATPHAFLWSGAIDKKVRGIFAGVVMTSTDSVGRRFPLVIGSPLPPTALVQQPHIAPLLLRDFFQEAAVAVARAHATKSAADFQAQIATMEPPAFDDTEATLAAYDTWAKGQQAGDVWNTLFGAADADRASRHALGMIFDATTPFRGQETPPLTLGVRVPLGSLGANVCALWIDLVRAAAGWKSTVPSFFVPIGPANPQALIQLGAEAPPSVLADIFVPTPDSESVCELGSSERAAPPASVRAEVTAAGSLADVVLEIGR